MSSQREYEALRDDYDALRLQFIDTELDLAITFCQIALSADSREKAERNLAHARRASQAASERLKTPIVGPGPRSTPEIDKKFRHLRKILADLKKHPPPRLGIASTAESCKPGRLRRDRRSV